jgi:chromosome segregation ATPase
MQEERKATAGYPIANGQPASPGRVSNRRPQGYTPPAPSSRVSAASYSARSAPRRSGFTRSPSPPRVQASELDQERIISLSQQCTEELNRKQQDKNALTEMLKEQKNKKMQYDAKLSKKKREVDSTVVQTLDLEKKLQMLNNTNKMMTAELAGLRSENERTQCDVDALREDLQKATNDYDRECGEVEQVKQTLFTYRKEITTETKRKDGVQQDLRAARTAFNLLMNRLDDMEKRNRAIKNCVANTINH